VGQIRRIEERPLGFGADAMDDAWANLATPLQRAGDRLQKGVPAFHRQWPAAAITALSSSSDKRMGGMGGSRLRAGRSARWWSRPVVRTPHRHDRGHATKGMAAAGQVSAPTSEFSRKIAVDF
jgi:hypothetical protein